MEITWKSADSYEFYMGRWSRLVARAFIKWLSPPAGLKWLDIGCGSGALSEEIVNNCHPTELIAIDQSENFVNEVQRRLGKLALCKVGNALSLPVKDNAVHFAVSGLVLNYISDPVKALVEMRRAVAPKGTAAIYVWDYSGKMDFLNKFWDAAVALDPTASTLHQGRRFQNTTAEALRGFFVDARYANIETAPMDTETFFQKFDDYWKPFLGGQGPAPTYLMSLDESARQKLRDRIFASLPFQADGTIRMYSRAWAVKGQA